MANLPALAFCCIGLYITTGTALPDISYEPLKIASFNIQILGLKKLNKTQVQSALVTIIQRYDVVMVQEIRDSSATAFDSLTAELNRASPLTPFHSVASARLGRSNSKEQYGVLYRPDRVTLTGMYQYEDGPDDGTDAFAREPFAVRFHSQVTELTDFAVISIHTAPKHAVEEVDALTSVYDDVVRHWDLEPVLLVGDFNADCSYLRGAAWANVSLRTDERFHWLIGDTEDTTVGYTDCSYDRFVTASMDLMNNLVPGSVGVYHFDEHMGLSFEDALDISDHYPIELQLRGKVNREFQSVHRSGISFVASSDEPAPNVNDVREIYRTKSDWLATEVLYDSSRMDHVKATAFHTDDVIGRLQLFRQTYPNVLTEDVLILVNAYLEMPLFRKNAFINGLQIHATTFYDVEVLCRLQFPHTCEVRVTKYLT